MKSIKKFVLLVLSLWKCYSVKSRALLRTITIHFGQLESNFTAVDERKVKTTLVD